MQQKAARNDKNVDTYIQQYRKKNLNVIFNSLLIITFIDSALQNIPTYTSNSKLNTARAQYLTITPNNEIELQI